MGNDLEEHLSEHFDPIPGSSVRVKLDSHEADLMRRLVAEMRSLLSEDAPDDPVATRLFPDAYESPEDARAFKELVGRELHADKLHGLAVMEASLGQGGGLQGTLGPEEAEAWLKSLTDMRLTLGTRLDVTDEDMAAGTEAASAPMAVLHWLGWLQEALLKAIEAGDS